MTLTKEYCNSGHDIMENDISVSVCAVKIQLGGEERGDNTWNIQIAHIFQHI